MSQIRIKQTTIMLAIVAGLGLGAQSAVAGYVKDSSKNVWKNSAGECWESMGPDEMLAECGDIADSDGDGVPDDKDKCPGTPAGVKVDAIGCPLDSDGDGVPDYADKCPGTAPGTPVDRDGCPLPEDRPEPRAVTPATVEVVIDRFDFDKSKLKPSMMDELDRLVARVKKTPANEQLVLVGHTDSVGTVQYNQGLSERRARSVADYLMSKGIGRRDIVTRGMSENKPVATNATEAGRAMNRRVEIHNAN